MTAIVILAALLAAIPAVNTLLNLRQLRTPPVPDRRPDVAILIPARDEASNIGPCVNAALASTGAEVEVHVLDDGSSDGTAQIVAAMASRDPRLHLHIAPPLPPGWRGKQHACHILSTLTERAVLLFIDADVRLASEAAARLAPPPGIDLVSGVPRQIVHGLVETAVVPVINSLIYGYLPVGLMRRRTDPSLAAACGQMIAVRADAYRACGGHAGIRTSSHDGLTLPRLFRRAGLRTDLVDGTTLATCRMYESAPALLAGFTKNATEGMARPLALPVWTVLLLGGQVLPFVLVALAAAADRPAALPEAALVVATLALVIARLAQARKVREPLGAVALHVPGLFLTLGIQWYALVRSRLGRPVEWRGRSFAPLR